jgi:hypothetical protein
VPTQVTRSSSQIESVTFRMSLSKLADDLS